MKRYTRPDPVEVVATRAAIERAQTRSMSFGRAIHTASALSSAGVVLGVEQGSNDEQRSP